MQQLLDEATCRDNLLVYRVDGSVILLSARSALRRRQENTTRHQRRSCGLRGRWCAGRMATAPSPPAIQVPPLSARPGANGRQSSCQSRRDRPSPSGRSSDRGASTRGASSRCGSQTGLQWRTGNDRTVRGRHRKQIRQRASKSDSDKGWLACIRRRAGCRSRGIRSSSIARTFRPGRGLQTTHPEPTASAAAAAAAWLSAL